MDSNEPNATPSEDATGAEAPAAPSAAGREDLGSGALMISPITLDAARAVYRHYADRLAARRMPRHHDDA
jgi:hypothetical protein